MAGWLILDVGIAASALWAASTAAQLQAAIFARVASLFLLLFLLLAAQEGLYRPGSAQEQRTALKAIAWASLLTFGTARPSATSTIALCAASAITLAIIVCTRWLYRTFINCDSGERTVLVVGSELAGDRLVESLLARTVPKHTLKSFLPEHHFYTAKGEAILKQIARREWIDEVVIATHDWARAEQIIHAAHRNQLEAAMVLPHDFAGPITLENAGGLTLLKFHGQTHPEWRLAAKRMADTLLAFSGLVVLSPLLLLIAMVIRLDSRGPAIYRSTGIGKQGRPFICNKFRTMTNNADAEKESLRARNERQRAFFKIANDPRITRVGQFLRRYSLDELPQLWNVLRGEMSLVGPRPHPRDDVEQYREQDLSRLDFVPGMTGLWQVTARQDSSFDRCVALDVEYIKRWSPLLDLQILCKTIFCVLQGNGA